MSQAQTDLDAARHDAQDLHKKISANIAKTDIATWADVTAVQADVAALAAKMDIIAKSEADAEKTGIRGAIGKLDAAAKQVQNKAVSVKDDVKRANAAMLESAHNAAQSLSLAIAALRTRVAKAIEPKKVLA